MSAPAIAEVIAKKFAPLTPDRLSFLDSKSVSHMAICPRETALEALTESGFWLSVAHRLQPLDSIRVVWDDRSAVAELMVMESSQCFVSVVLLSHRQLPGMIGDGSMDLVNFEVFFSSVPMAGGLPGYAVRRLSDQVLIITGASSKAAAIEALKAHPSFKME